MYINVQHGTVLFLICSTLCGWIRAADRPIILVFARCGLDFILRPAVSSYLPVLSSQCTVLNYPGACIAKMIAAIAGQRRKAC